MVSPGKTKFSLTYARNRCCSSARFKIESHEGDKSRCDPATRRGEERRRERSEAGRATGERLSLQRKADRGADKACHYAKSLSQMTIIR